MRKYLLVWLLALTAVAMAAIKIAYRNYEWPKPAVEVLPTSTPTPTSAPTIDEQYPLWKLLPYEGKGFVVDRYIEPLTLAVTAKGIDKKIVEKEVWQWLLDNQVATESHKLIIN